MKQKIFLFSKHVRLHAASFYFRQFRHKIVAIDRFCSSPELMAKLLTHVQRLLLRALSDDWERAGARRWILKLLPRVLLVNPGARARGRCYMITIFAN
jgi:hypothetical protein